MPITAVLWRVTGHFNHAHLETTTGEECIPLGRWLESRGFRVAEHPAFGGVHPVHKGRAHYEGRAIDVNFGPGGESDVEKRAFDALIPSVLRRGVDVYQFASQIKQPGEDDLTEELQRHLDGIEARISQRILDARTDLRGHVDVHVAGIEEKRVGGITRLALKLDAIRAAVDAIEPNRVKGIDRLAGKLDKILEELDGLANWDVAKKDG